MNENTKTSVYVGAAVVLALVVILLRPSVERADPNEEEGKPLFGTLTETNAVVGIEIDRYDKDKGRLMKLTVAKEKDGWELGTHSNYPAEHHEQITKAAGSLIGVVIVKFISGEMGQHRLYGVVAPTEEAIEENDTGLGTKIVLRDQGGQSHGLIIGNKVAKAGQGGEQLYYVRRDNENLVFTVKVDPGDYSTNLDDWIKEDLLEVSGWDVKQVSLNDYSIHTDGGPAIEYRSEITVQSDASDWKVVQYRRPDRKTSELVPATLAADQELDATKLADLKSAINDLDIVEVERKPAQLAEDLRTGSGIRPLRQSAKSLGERGFYLVQAQENDFKLYSDEGEILLRTEDGIEYVLRFGQIAGIGEKGSAGDSAEKKKEQPGDKANGQGDKSDDEEVGLNRYIFVMANFRQDMIPLPEKPEELKDPAAKDTKDAKDNKDGKDAKDAKDGKDGKPSPPADKADGEAKEKDAAQNDSTEKGDALQSDEAQDQADEDELDEDDLKVDDKKDDAKKDDTKKDDAKKDDAAKKKEEADAKKKQEEDAHAQAAARRKQAELDYQKNLEEYEKKIVDGREKVRQLNDRFADWFYVVPEKTYKKLRLTADDIIKKKEKKDDPAKGGGGLKLPPGLNIPGLPGTQ